MRRTLSRKALVTLGVVTLLLGLLGVFAFPHLHARAAASADVDLVTQGDAKAFFHTFLNCRLAIQGNLHADVQQPCEDFPRAFIHPFISDAHYCVDDWHVDAIADVLFPQPGQSAADVLQEFTLFTASLWLDGQPVATTQTPVKFAAEFAPNGAYWEDIGALLPPGALSVGTHTLHDEFVDPVGGAGFVDQTFTVDASGTGVCLVA